MKTKLIISLLFSSTFLFGEKEISFQRADTVFYGNGAIKMINYLDSSNIRRAVKYYSLSGNLVFIKNYNKLGSEHGLSLSWYETGEISAKTRCVNGECEVQEYYEGGSLKSIYKTKNKSIVIGYYYTFFEQGGIASCIEFDSGRALVRKNYYPSGELKSRLNVTDYDNARGTFVRYFKSGKIQLKGELSKIQLLFNLITLEASKRTGVWYEFNEESEVIKEEVH